MTEVGTRGIGPRAMLQFGSRLALSLSHRHLGLDRMHRPFGFSCVVSLLALSVVHAERSSAIVYERDIRPIFRAHCFDCHGSTDEFEGDLDLRQVRRILSGGQSGPAIERGHPDASLLLQRIRDGEMPPGAAKVPQHEIDRITAWIADGAPTVRPEPEHIGSGLGITEEERSFWSFQPVSRPNVVSALASGRSRHGGLSRVRTAIDALMLAQMPSGVGFSPDADRFTLIRRAYLDLLGLAPTTAEMKYWQNVSHPDWFDRLLDELLSSPRYGERWGRHWLDVVGYADSEGATVSDAERKWAWPYRDWIIKAFNNGKPFDEFLTEQLAGDELAGPIVGSYSKAQTDLLTATGFLRMAADGTGSGADTPEGRNQVIADTLKIVGTALLGLSVQCAQCHDHRYDPIPQTDYYALRAVFEPAFDWQNWKNPSARLISLATPDERARAGEIEQQAQAISQARQKRLDELITEQLEKNLERVDDVSLREPLRVAYRTDPKERTEEQNQLLASYPFVRQLSPGSLYLYNQKAADELKAMDAEASKIRAQKPPENFRRVLQEPTDRPPPETKLFHRGDFRQPKQSVSPAGLSVLGPDGRGVPISYDGVGRVSSGRRFAFAKWLTDAQNPLLPRVIANRIWLHHFGRGLVDTPADFGRLGSLPSHPSVLDWLAYEWVENNWDLKHLHRIIMRSTVWRQQSQTVPSQRVQEVDADNRLYWRKPLVRLEAETIRDRMIQAAGELDVKMYGPPIPVKEDGTGQVDVGGHQTRRSIYVQVRRSRPVAMMQAFDAPVMETNCEVRRNSTVATQSLMLMNGSFTWHLAERLAARTEWEATTLNAAGGNLVKSQIELAWQATLARRPTPQELSLASNFVAEQFQLLHKHPDRRRDGKSVHQQVMTNLCQGLLICNEFLYID